MIKLEQMSEHRMALSVAASWAWGTGFLAGTALLQQKGLIPFLMWSIANIGTLSLFGFLCQRKLFDLTLWEKPIMKVISFFMQVYIFIFNVNCIYTVLLRVFNGNTILSYIVASIIAFIFVMLMLKVGLKGCVLSDGWKLLVAYGFGFLYVIGGLLSNKTLVDIPLGLDGISTGAYTMMILLLNPIPDRQHWQRVYNSSPKAYYLGSLYFSGYVIIMFFAGFFRENTFMSICAMLLVVLLSIATLDSSVVAWTDYKIKYPVKVLIGVILSFSWIISMGKEFLTFWLMFTKIIIFVAVFTILYAIYLKIKEKHNNKEKI